MLGVGSRDRPLRDRVAQAEHQVVFSEVEALDRQREQRQQVAIVTVNVRQALQKRGDDAVALDGPADRSFAVEESKEIRVRKQLAGSFQALRRNLAGSILPRCCGSSPTGGG